MQIRQMCLLIKKSMNFMCQICSKSFGDTWKLKRHEKIHVKSGELSKPSNSTSEENILKEEKMDIEEIMVEN